MSQLLNTLTTHNRELHFSKTNLSTFIKTESDKSATNPDPSNYLYSREVLKNRIQTFEKTLKDSLNFKLSFHYALKANSHAEILKTVNQSGWGADVVSLGELKKAIAQKIDPAHIIYSGVGKTVHEITEALKSQVGQINVESPNELKRISEIAEKMGVIAPVSIRVNPHVDAKTHPYISTGFRENKFGVDESEISELLYWIRDQKNLQLRGLALHIGSQLKDFSALAEALEKIRKFTQTIFEIRALNNDETPLYLDVGGGVGIQYEDNADMDQANLDLYAKTLKESFKGFNPNTILSFEPGRFIVGRSGLLLTQVQYIKKTQYKNFVIVGSGMNHLLRPALYQAYHRILQINESASTASDTLVADIVGPVCESADFLGQQRVFKNLKEGDWLCVCDAGAYGMSMASDYNSFEKPIEIFVD